MHKQNRSDREIGLENVMESMYEGKSHNCASHVEHAKWGKGECVAEQHAEPLYGSVEWYTVVFEHGTEKVDTCDLTILKESSHMHASHKSDNKKKCTHCKGTGKHGDKKCPKCKGTGVLLISAGCGVKHEADDEDTGRIPHDVDSFGSDIDHHTQYKMDRDLLNPLHAAAQKAGADNIEDWMIKQIKDQGEEWVNWFMHEVIGQENI